MVLHAKQLISNGTLSVNLAETILPDRLSTHCRTQYTVISIFECASFICFSAHCCNSFYLNCFFSLSLPLSFCFGFGFIERGKRKWFRRIVNAHAISQFHWITTDFLISSSFFFHLIFVCACVRSAQINPSSMNVCVNFEETTLSHIVGVRRQAFCQPPLKCQTYSNCNKRKMHSNQIEAL